MLVLSRQRGETICIGSDVSVTVLDIRGDKVRLGVTAPTAVPVHREEVSEAIAREAAREGREFKQSRAVHSLQARVEVLMERLLPKRGQLVSVNEVLAMLGGESA